MTENIGFYVNYTCKFPMMDFYCTMGPS